MKTGFVKSLAFVVGTSLFFAPVAFSVSGCSGTTTIPSTYTQDAESIVALLQAFGVIKTDLTSAQLAEIASYLSGTQTPDVAVIVGDLITMGVIPSGGLTPVQVTAIVTLLQNIGFNVLDAGVPVHAELVKAPK